MTAIKFPDTPIDGRMRHSHPRYLGVDHGDDEGESDHFHEGAGHLVDIGRAAGIVYEGDEMWCQECFPPTIAVQVNGYRNGAELVCAKGHVWKDRR